MKLRPIQDPAKAEVKVVEMTDEVKARMIKVGKEVYDILRKGCADEFEALAVLTHMIETFEKAMGIKCHSIEMLTKEDLKTKDNN